MNKITLSCLGRLGRWGNQVFQYAFARTYARRYGLEYQVPAWEGQRLLGLEDPSITWNLPQYTERYDTTHANGSDAKWQDAWCPQISPKGQAVVNHDYRGYCQFHTSYYAPERQFIKHLFTPTETLRKRLGPAVEKLRSRGKLLVGLHMRRGDTGRAIFYLTPNRWYRTWLEDNWDRLGQPSLFVASEDPKDVEEFRGFGGVSAADLLDLTPNRYGLYNYLQYDLRHPTSRTMDWFPDWYLLQQCDVLLLSNSTFSFTSAWTSPNDQEVWRSRLSTQTFEQIDPWDCRPLTYEHLDDYPGIPNTRYHSNKYWLKEPRSRSRRGTR
jgi:hypothetical protein